MCTMAFANTIMEAQQFMNIVLSLWLESSYHIDQNKVYLDMKVKYIYLWPLKILILEAILFIILVQISGFNDKNRSNPTS